jgi:hypothetical protein
MIDWARASSRLRAQPQDDARDAVADEQFFLQYICTGRARRHVLRTDMANIFRMLLLAAAFSITGPADAAIRILATTTDWGALATELGDKVDVHTATSALQDVHP